MKTLLDVVVTATGTPSEVVARVNAQLAGALGAGGEAEQAQIAAAIRTYVDRIVKPASEDDTLAVKVSVVVAIADAPPIVTEKQKAEREKHAGELREAQAETAKVRGELETAKAALADAAKPKEGETGKSGFTPAPQL